jgi:hypothetical protein
MSERLLHRFVEREHGRAASDDRAVAGAAADASSSRILSLPTESEAAEDFGAFGWLRGAKERAVMLELRQRTGNIIAIGYGWLERAEFDPSIGITLLVPGQRILIRGRNLNAEIRPNVLLFEGITRHRVPWVAEYRDCNSMLRNSGCGDDASVLIESIQE